MLSSSFSQKIISWYHVHKRNLPWRDSQNPYLIWLSEIILQQTRVEQGKPYYYRFAEKFADIKNFAAADEHDILKLWQGLGYYSRARNMHHAAQTIVNDFDGKFPESYFELRKLKGVGDYTAAAISSFAFNLPHAVVDGNVYRFLSRHFGIDIPVDSSDGKKQFAELANKLLHKKNPAAHNQAMMEIGAMICKPQNPLCLQCPVNSSCEALQKNIIDRLPVKSKKIIIKNRHLFYFLIIYKNKFIIKKRTGNDIWKNLYDLPLIETIKSANPEKVLLSQEFTALIGEASFTINKISKSYTHKLTHQNLHTIFINATVQHGKVNVSDDMQFVSFKNANRYVFPKLIESYLKKEKILS